MYGCFQRTLNVEINCAWRCMSQHSDKHIEDDRESKFMRHVQMAKQNKKCVESYAQHTHLSLLLGSNMCHLRTKHLISQPQRVPSPQRFFTFYNTMSFHSEHLFFFTFSHLYIFCVALFCPPLSIFRSALLLIRLSLFSFASSLFIGWQRREDQSSWTEEIIWRSKRK